MQKNKNVFKIVGALVLLGALAFGVKTLYPIFISTGDEKEEGKEGDDIVISTTTENGSVGVVSGSGDFTIEPITPGAVKPSIPAPSLDRPVVIPAYFPAETHVIMKERIVATVLRLKDNPENWDTWFNLALDYKMIDDYEGARLIWEYLTLVFPNSSIAFGNLGNLHHYYLKDYPKSEANYLKAIKNEPNQVALYRETHDLYRLSYKTETTAAADILLQGLKNNPGNIDLLILLAGYYREKGDKVSARKYYEQALAVLSPTGINRDLEGQIQTILNNLK